MNRTSASFLQRSSLLASLPILFQHDIVRKEFLWFVETWEILFIRNNK